MLIAQSGVFMNADIRYNRDIFSTCTAVCNEHKENILFKFEGNEISYGEIYEKIVHRAAFLKKSGFKKGDIIGIISENSPDWSSTFFAITSIGAIALPLDTNLSKKQHNEMLKEVKAKAVFASDTYKSKYSVKSFDITKVDPSVKTDKFTLPSCSIDTIGVLIFTSGTTGTPKIVTLTHQNLLHIANACTDLEEYTAKDQTLAMLPFYHIYALESNLLAPFVTGSTIIMLNSLKGPDIMQCLADNDITIFPAAPIMWEMFFDGIANKARSESEKKYKLLMFFIKNAPILRKLGLGFLVKKIFTPIHEVFGLSHRFFISGGASMKKEYFKYYKNMGFEIMEGYGLSETTGPIAIPYYKKSKAGSVGPPIMGNEVKIKNINADGIGEICLKGAAVSPGYYKNKEANQKAYDEEGFFSTGDLGRLDKEGNIYITGRLKNVIVLDTGKNIYPEEVEFYYRNSEKIKEIAIFEQKINDRTTAFGVIVPSKKNQNSYKDIKNEIELMNKDLPDYKRIKQFSISFDELPKNSTKKIMYPEVIKMLEAGNYQANSEDEVVLKDVLTGADPRESRIIDLLKLKLKENLLYANSTPSDFNIDSLGLIDLVAYLEQNLHITIDSLEFRKKETLGEILLYVASLKEGDGEPLEKIIFEGEILHKPNRIFNPFHHIVLGLFKLISVALWKVKVNNKERLVLNNNIIVSNHQSYLDMVWIAFSIPRKYRKEIYVTGKKRLSFLKIVFPILPLILVDDKNGIDVLKAGADLLRQGKTLIIFPEGTRSKDGEIQNFMSGAAYLAKNLNIDIIPVTVKGAFKIWPANKKLPSLFTKKEGSLTIGETISPKKFKTVNSLNSALFKSVNGELNSKTKKIKAKSKTA